MKTTDLPKLKTVLDDMYKKLDGVQLAEHFIENVRNKKIILTPYIRNINVYTAYTKAECIILGRYK